jgi:hypothetical protein
MSTLVEVIDALALLTPSEVPSVTKVRLGNKLRDGGYILADRLRAGQIVYSYGISNDVSFDLDVAGRGLVVFMYDHTIAALPARHVNFRFFPQGIGPADRPETAIFTLARQLRHNAHPDADMILKMDVEGAEWDTLDAMEAATLCRFEQIVLELHQLDELHQDPFRQRMVRVLNKLNGMFNLIHVHANNTVRIRTVLELPVPPLLEVTFLRKDLGAATDWRTFIPSALDVPNVMRDDHVLAFFPFLPTGLTPTAFRAGLTKAYLRATQPRQELAARHGTRIATRGGRIAAGAVCAQSSLSRWSTGADEAARALRTAKTGGFAFHTDFEDGPWWRVDLGRAVKFDEILCYNRLDACSDRAARLLVEISGDGGVWDIIHRNVVTFGGLDGNPLRVRRPGTTARYLRLRLPGRTALHLDGVEIYDWDLQPATDTA